MKDLNYGKNYGYAHDHAGNFVEQEFLPEEIKGTSFYSPNDNPSESKFKQRLQALWKNKYRF